MENLTEDQFIDECLRDLVAAHRENGKTPQEFLKMLHPLERRSIACKLLELGVIKRTGGFLRKSYVWA